MRVGIALVLCVGIFGSTAHAAPITWILEGEIFDAAGIPGWEAGERLRMELRFDEEATAEISPGVDLHYLLPGSEPSGRWFTDDDDGRVVAIVARLPQGDGVSVTSLEGVAEVGGTAFSFNVGLPFFIEPLPDGIPLPLIFGRWNARLSGRPVGSRVKVPLHSSVTWTAQSAAGLLDEMFEQPEPAATASFPVFREVPEPSTLLPFLALAALTRRVRGRTAAR